MDERSPRGSRLCDRATEAMPQHFSIDTPPVDQQDAREASAPKACERVDCGVHTEMTLSLKAMCVEWTPTIHDAGVPEKIMEGVGAKT